MLLVEKSVRRVGPSTIHGRGPLLETKLGGDVDAGRRHLVSDKEKCCFITCVHADALRIRSVGHDAFEHREFGDW